MWRNSSKSPAACWNVRVCGLWSPCVSAVHPKTLNTSINTDLGRQQAQWTDNKKIYPSQKLEEGDWDGRLLDSGAKTCWLDKRQHDRYWDNSTDFVSGTLPSADLRDLTHGGSAESLVIPSSSPFALAHSVALDQYGLTPNAERNQL